MEIVCRMVSAPIDIKGAIGELVRSTDGAVATFTGIVRDHHRGRQVTHLEYHAYPEMAEEELQRIAGELGARHDLGGLALVHRTGTLSVGETAVLVAAAAPHRKAALAAVSEGIEAIKRRLPVWKKEFFTDGGEPAWVFGPDEACVTSVPARAGRGEETGG